MKSPKCHYLSCSISSILLGKRNGARRLCIPLTANMFLPSLRYIGNFEMLSTLLLDKALCLLLCNERETQDRKKAYDSTEIYHQRSKTALLTTKTCIVQPNKREICLAKCYDDYYTWCTGTIGDYGDSRGSLLGGWFSLQIIYLFHSFPEQNQGM